MVTMPRCAVVDFGVTVGMTGIMVAATDAASAGTTTIGAGCVSVRCGTIWLVVSCAEVLFWR